MLHVMRLIAEGASDGDEQEETRSGPFRHTGQHGQPSIYVERNRQSNPSYKTYGGMYTIKQTCLGT